MNEVIKFYVGLDAHKDSTSIAVCEAGSREPERFAGTVRSDVKQLLKVLAKAGDPSTVSVVYEAGRRAMACTGSCAAGATAAKLLPRR